MEQFNDYIININIIIYKSIFRGCRVLKYRRYNVKNYKVFFLNEEVAEFDTIKECKEYILEQLENDKALYIINFNIYGKLD